MIFDVIFIDLLSNLFWSGTLPSKLYMAYTASQKSLNLKAYDESLLLTAMVHSNSMCIQLDTLENAIPIFCEILARSFLVVGCRRISSDVV